MSAFVWGLLAGAAGTLVAAGGAGAWAYHRWVLLERRARQAERLAEIGTLTGGLAHEIKNPLSTVQLNLQLLREDLDPDIPAYGRLTKRLDTVRRETGRLRDILDDFLRYAGRIEVEKRATNLNDLLDELADFFAPQAQAQRVALRVRTSPAPVVTPVDAKLVKQAVLNLMINALQAMPDGGELILSVSQHPHRAVIDVIDTGPGIDADTRGRIFQAYYTTKRSGTGLGLAMARRIAHEHGGDIEVRSDIGKGSDFSISLPLR